VLFQDGEDVLEEIELFVTRARPEIIAMNDERLFSVKPTNCLEGHLEAAERLYTGYQSKRLTG